MDRLTELGTARGFAEQRVARAEAELAEAKTELGKCVGAYIDYVKLHPPQIDPPSFADTCCGKCPGDTCYVDQMTGA